MYKIFYTKIKNEVSGINAKHYVRDISTFHRIQATPGFHDCADYCVEKLEEAKLDGVEILKYPYDGKKKYLGQNSFQEWYIKNARLEITQPQEKAKLLCNFRDTPISVIQRSNATPPEGIDTELVLLEDGTKEEHYEDKDIESKIVLTSALYGDQINTVRSLAVEKYGALGIITDGMPSNPVRHPMDLVDDRNYTSWWLTGKEKKCFGFVLTPKQGVDLRQLIKETESGGEKVKVSAKIEATFYDGFLENVTALITGIDYPDEEVLILAHLCHPSPSANDNASGSGAAIEAVRLLQSLISKGELPRPKRSIRVLLVPEMAGSYAFIATQNPGYKAIAGINLDMVGEDQAQTKGPLMITKTPDSLPSFTNTLLIKIVEETVNQYRGLKRKHPTINWTVSEFTGGSDHYIFNDPSVGTPMQMIGHWPDPFYHSSADTIDKVSESEMEKVAIITATYAYSIANAGQKEVAWVSGETAKHSKQRIINHVHNTVSDLALLKSRDEVIDKYRSFEESIDYIVEIEKKVIKSSGELIHGDLDGELLFTLNLYVTEIEELAARELEYTRKLVENKIGKIPPKHILELNEIEKEAAAITPSRMLKGPPDSRFLKSIMSEKDYQKYQGRLDDNPVLIFLFDMVLFWMDGERDLFEIAKKVQLQTGFSFELESILEYVKLLKKYDISRWSSV
jgi:aminopeptidase-like protein